MSRIVIRRSGPAGRSAAQQLYDGGYIPAPTTEAMADFIDANVDRTRPEYDFLADMQAVAAGDIPVGAIAVLKSRVTSGDGGGWYRVLAGSPTSNGLTANGFDVIGNDDDTLTFVRQREFRLPFDPETVTIRPLHRPDDLHRTTVFMATPLPDGRLLFTYHEGRRQTSDGGHFGNAWPDQAPLKRAFSTSLGGQITGVGTIYTEANIKMSFHQTGVMDNGDIAIVAARRRFGPGPVPIVESYVNPVILKSTDGGSSFTPTLVSADDIPEWSGAGQQHLLRWPAAAGGDDDGGWMCFSAGGDHVDNVVYGLFTRDNWATHEAHVVAPAIPGHNQSSIAVVRLSDLPGGQPRWAGILRNAHTEDHGDNPAITYRITDPTDWGPDGRANVPMALPHMAMWRDGMIYWLGCSRAGNRELSPGFEGFCHQWLDEETFWANHGAGWPGWEPLVGVNGMEGHPVFFEHKGHTFATFGFNNFSWATPDAATAGNRLRSVVGLLCGGQQFPEGGFLNTLDTQSVAESWRPDYYEILRRNAGEFAHRVISSQSTQELQSWGTLGPSRRIARRARGAYTGAPAAVEAGDGISVDEGYAWDGTDHVLIGQIELRVQSVSPHYGQYVVRLAPIDGGAVEDIFRLDHNVMFYGPASASIAPQPANNRALELTAEDGDPLSRYTGFGQTNPSVVGRRAGGSAAAPAAPPQGAHLFRMVGQGYPGDGILWRNGARIAYRVRTATASLTDMEATILFEASPTASISLTQLGTWDHADGMVLSTVLSLWPRAVAQLPTAGVFGRMVACSNGDAGAPALLFDDGTDWRVVPLGAVASSS